jgi:hypothetical protein
MSGPIIDAGRYKYVKLASWGKWLVESGLMEAYFAGTQKRKDNIRKLYELENKPGSVLQK